MSMSNIMKISKNKQDAFHPKYQDPCCSLCSIFHNSTFSSAKRVSRIIRNGPELWHSFRSELFHCAPDDPFSADDTSLFLTTSWHQCCVWSRKLTGYLVHHWSPTSASIPNGTDMINWTKRHSVWDKSLSVWNLANFGEQIWNVDR